MIIYFSVLSEYSVLFIFNIIKNTLEFTSNIQLNNYNYFSFYLILPNPIKKNYYIKYTDNYKFISNIF